MPKFWQVGTKQVRDSAIDTADLAADCVTGAKIADDAVDSEHYTDGSVDSVHCAVGGTTNDTTFDTPLKVLTHAFTAADFDGDDDLVVTCPAMHILDVYCINLTAEGGALTGTLYDTADAGGNAISSALDLNSTAVQRTTTVANNSVSAGSVYFNASGNPGTTAGTLVIVYA